jgi:hypothetical protein
MTFLKKFVDRSEMNAERLLVYKSLYFNTPEEVRAWYRNNRAFLVSEEADPLWDFLRTEIQAGRYELFLAGAATRLIPYWCCNTFLELAPVEALSKLDPKVRITPIGREILFRRALFEETLVDKWVNLTNSKVDYDKLLHLVLTLPGENNFLLIHSLGKEFHQQKKARISKHLLRKCPPEIQSIFSRPSGQVL